MPHYFNKETSELLMSKWPPPSGDKWIEVDRGPPDPFWKYTYENGEYVEKPEKILMPIYRKNKLNELANWYANEQEQGVNLMDGTRMRTVDEARRDYHQLTTIAILAIQSGRTDNIRWHDADNNVKFNTPEEWVVIIGEYSKLAAIQRYLHDDYEDAIHKTQTKLQLDKIIFGE